MSRDPSIFRKAGAADGFPDREAGQTLASPKPHHRHHHLDFERTDGRHSEVYTKEKT